MCGIAGFFDRGCAPGEAPGRLGRMLDLIVHRGPDGAGTFVSEELGLAAGMRRLSIIDLEGGTQPIWNEEETVGVVFNGEIYNYVELRRELVGRGHRFRTESDTEVLVHLYEELGPGLVERLRGMFAFAIFDLRRRELLVARDHFGQKPLYYAHEAGRLAFASELKCLLALPWVSDEREPEALLDYVSWLSLPPPRTHFRKIKKLGAGQRFVLAFDAPEKLRAEQYWRYSLADAPRLTELELAAEALDATLTDSVQAHLRADVPLGVLLSSGLDSRTVAAYSQELLGGGMTTFTVGFEGPESELKEAAKTAREIGSTHHALEITSRDLSENIGRVAWHLDEPVGDPAAFAVLAVCEMAREHVKVLLSGEGADELFGGYDGRYRGMLGTMARSDKLRKYGAFLPEADPAAAPTRWRRFLLRAKQARATEAIGLRVEGLPGDVREPRGLSASQLRRLQARKAELGRGLYRPQRDRLSELLTLDLEWQLAESLLQKADKMSMAASIELRTPLLDTRVAEVAARIDSTLKLPPGGPGKLVLRQCLARKLNEPLTRPKKGFPVPLKAWFAGPLREQVEGALFSANSAAAAQLEGPLVREAWDDFLAGYWDGARFFYALWLYEEWARQLSGSRLQHSPALAHSLA
jgi:asparagine synthase (glutamine-hydrolysing)